MSISIKSLLLLLILIITIGIALNVGKFSLTPQQLWDVVQAKFTGSSGGDDPVLSRNMTVFWQIRLPRIAAALVIGGGLAMAGAAYQGMFRNPLVSPDILGVSAGAGVGAILGIFFWSVNVHYPAVRLYRRAVCCRTGVFRGAACPSA